MAWAFDDASSQYATLADDAALTLSGDWAVCGWFRLHDDTSTGTDIPRIFCWGTPGGTPHAQVFVPEGGNGFVNDDNLSCRVIDDAGTDSGIFEIADTFSMSPNQNEWIPFCLTNDDAGDTLHLYAIRDAFSTGGTVFANSAAVNLGSVNPAADLHFGAIPSLAAAGFLDGDLGQFAKFDRFFSQDDFRAWTRSCAFSWAQPSCAWHVPMLRGGATFGRYEELIGQLTVTNNGTTDSTAGVPGAVGYQHSAGPVTVAAAGGGGPPGPGRGRGRGGGPQTPRGRRQRAATFVRRNRGEQDVLH